MTNESALHAAYEHIARVAVGLVNGGSDIAPQLFVFPDLDAKLPMIPVDPALVSVAHRSAAGKEAMMALVRKFLDRGADAVIYVSEAWLRSFEGPRAAQQTAAFIASGVAPSESPERTEALIVAVHTLAGTWSGMMPIITEGNRRRTQYVALDLNATMVGRMAVDPPAHPH